MKVLLVEDQNELGKDIQTYLSDNQIICEWVETYLEAEDKISAFDYDIIAVDLMLPDGNGLNIIRYLKDIKSESSIFIISAKNSLDDKIKGLELGADDYLAKPFHLAEFKARLNALYRRKNLKGFNNIIFNEIEIDTNARVVLIHQVPTELTAKEYDLLLYFIANKNRVLGKQMIAEHLWGDYVDSLDQLDFIYQHIKNLRKKLLKFNCKPYISNVYGLGYKFNVNL